jgi:hypothetical protein
MHLAMDFKDVKTKEEFETKLLNVMTLRHEQLKAAKYAGIVAAIEAHSPRPALHSEAVSLTRESSL